MSTRKKGPEEAEASEAKPEPEATEESGAGDAQSLLSEFADSASEGIRQGIEDAEAAAEKTLPAIKQGIQAATYSSGYYAAFGMVYAGKLLLDMLPEEGAMRQGVMDGAQAASDTFERRKAARERTQVEADGEAAVSDPDAVSA